MVSKQWFVKMEPLAKPAIESVEKGEIKFVPERFTKNYMNWMKGQPRLVHQPPAVVGPPDPGLVLRRLRRDRRAPRSPLHLPQVRLPNMTQDPDTLDTWFSSALWPFSTLGWPDENAEDFNYFYPTNTLVTGYDIICFWVPA